MKRVVKLSEQWRRDPDMAELLVRVLNNYYLQFDPEPVR